MFESFLLSYLSISLHAQSIHKHRIVMMMREVIHITANSSFRAFMQMNDCHPPQSFSLRRRGGRFSSYKTIHSKRKNRFPV